MSQDPSLSSLAPLSDPPDELVRRVFARGAAEPIRAVLQEALAALLDACGGRKAMVIMGEHPRDWITCGLDDRDLDDGHALASTGILARSLKLGETVVTASAMEDPRFHALRSVQAQRMEAALCVPVRGVAGVVGGVFVLGRHGHGGFSTEQVAAVERFARGAALLVERLRTEEAPAPTVDATTRYRSRLSLDALVGTSAALAEVFRHVAVAAANEFTVLFTGETGVGKTEFARAVHRNSRRAAGPFIELNCAALPEALFEAELFGAERGAHSTATRRMPGKVAAAQGGTLLLDEIGEVPLSAQPKLLQLLQSRTYWPLGGVVAQEADVRILAATNVDLLQAVREKRFREDLYYRLHVLSVEVPPLRDRREDIAPLAERFANAAATAVGLALGFGSSTRAALTAMDWPGNARELGAAMQRGVAFAASEGATEITLDHLFPSGSGAKATDPRALPWEIAVRAFQRRYLEDALAACDGNVSEAARRLGLARSSLNALIKAHGVSPRR